MGELLCRSADSGEGAVRSRAYNVTDLERMAVIPKSLASIAAGQALRNVRSATVPDAHKVSTANWPWRSVKNWSGGLRAQTEAL